MTLTRITSPVSAYNIMHDQCILLIQIADTSIFNMMNNKKIVMYVFLDADVLCSLKVDLNQSFK